MKPSGSVPSILALSLMSASSVHVFAGEADVIAAEAKRQSDGRYTVSATIRHTDEGSEHYADRFDVLTPDGTVIGERILAHPHVDEQPFTRSLGGVVVPAGVSELRVRANDKVHGLGGKEATIRLSP